MIVTIHTPSHTFQSLEQRESYLIPVREKIERIAKEKFSRSTVLKYWLKSLKGVDALRVVVLPVYAGLVGAGLLTSYASVNLLYNGDYASAFSSDVSARVNFANTITNAGALFASVTDLPAITYVVYLITLQPAHRQAAREALDRSYQLALDGTIPDAELHEELYQWYVEKLQTLGVDNYYLHPDPSCETGQMHQELSTTLAEIDQELQIGLSLKDNWRSLCKYTIAEFRKSSCAKQIGKTAVLVLALSTASIATMLIIENGLLIKDTPVSDLFSGNSTTQVTEASYLTQVGNLFCSLTSIGIASYVTYNLFLKKAYEKSMRERIKSAFTSRMENLTDNTLRDELYRIKSFRLKKYS